MKSLEKIWLELAKEQKVNLYAEDDINAIIKQWQKVNNELGEHSKTLKQTIQQVNGSKQDLKQLENKLELLIETVQEGAAELGIRQLPKYATNAQQMLKMWYAAVEGFEAAVKRSL